MRPRFPQERARPQGRLRCPGAAPLLLLCLALLPIGAQAQVQAGEQWALSESAHVLTVENCDDGLCAKVTASIDPALCGAIILDRLRPHDGKLRGVFVDPAAGARYGVEIDVGPVVTFLDGPTALDVPLTLPHSPPPPACRGAARR